MGRILAAPRFDTIPSAPSVLLIGCGAIGAVIARHLTQSQSISEVRLADVDPSASGRLARETASSKAKPISLDANDSRALEDASRDCAVVVNAALPQLNEKIQRAALSVGAHYLDLANPTSDPFTLDGEWRARDRTAIIGLGEDPGLSNLFARYAADAMDRVGSIRIRDGDTATSPEYPFVCLFSPETFIQETLNPSRIWEDGGYHSVPPFGRPETYPFPPPVGPLRVYAVDHEEVDTLPRLIGKGVQYVDFKLALDDDTVRTLQTFRDLNLLERGTVEAPGPRRAILSAIPKPADLAGKVHGTAALVVEVEGTLNGKRRLHVPYTILDHEVAAGRFHATGTAYLTGSPAAAGVILLATGRIPQRGVVSPESLDPKPVFDLLRAAGIALSERITLENPIL